MISGFMGFYSARQRGGLLFYVSAAIASALFLVLGTLYAFYYIGLDIPALPFILIGLIFAVTMLFLNRRHETTITHRAKIAILMSLLLSTMSLYLIL